MSQINIYLTDPGAPVPVPQPIEPDIPTPNTGGSLFDGATATTTDISIAVIIAIITLITIIAIILYRRNHHNYRQSLRLSYTKATILRLTVILMIVGLASVLLVHQEESNELAIAADNTLSITVDDVVINAEKSATGTFATASNTVTVNAATEDGYTLSVYAESSDLTLDSDNNTNNENTSTSSNNNDTVSPAKISGLSTSDKTILTTNTWGIALNQTTYPTNDPNNPVWQMVPTTDAAALTVKDTDSVTPAGDKTTVYYGINVDDTLPAGTYTNTLIYTAIAKSAPEPYIPSYTITDVQPSTYIDPNGGEIITVMTDAANQSTTAFTVSSVTVGGTACTNPTVTTTPDTVSSSHRVIVCTAPAKSTGTYDVVANITDTTTGNPATLTKTNAVTYATIQFGGISSMQDMTSTVCNAVTAGTTGALKDARDNQIYRVFKALDGNCWMQENLRYGAMPETTDSPTARPYDSNDDALSDNMNTTKMTNLDSSHICTASSRCKDVNGDNMFTAGTNNEGYENPYIMIYQANTSATYDGKTKYGVMYNYCAATGGTACTAYSTTPTVSGSICPAGWTLPSFANASTGSGGITDGTVKSYDNFLNVYGIADLDNGLATLVASPLNFVRAGDAVSGQLQSRSSSGNGGYWSASPSSVQFACILDFGSFNVRQLSGYRYSGSSVRCVSS